MHTEKEQAFIHELHLSVMLLMYITGGFYLSFSSASFDYYFVLLQKTEQEKLEKLARKVCSHFSYYSSLLSDFSA